jgi:hypothetical protein
VIGQQERLIEPRERKIELGPETREAIGALTIEGRGLIASPIESHYSSLDGVKVVIEPGTVQSPIGEQPELMLGALAIAHP